MRHQTVVWVVWATTGGVVEGYEYLSGVEERALASACGVENLTTLASPIPGYTTGEVGLLFAEKYRLVEALAPHLLWLRRGALFGSGLEDWEKKRQAGSCALSPSRLPGASFDHTTKYKLQHDIEQFEYLAAKGWRSTWLREVVIPAYETVRKRATASETGYYELSRQDKLLVGATYNRALIFDPTELNVLREPTGALNEHVPWARADAQFGPRSVIFVDDVLKPSVLDRLLEYCMSATLYFETKVEHAGGHLGAYVVDGFAAPLLFQIAQELRAKLPSVLGDLPLRNLWSYKYTQQERGIMVHTDQAKINVNLWISPSHANLDPRRGGLRIYDPSSNHDRGSSSDDGDNGGFFSRAIREPSITPPQLQGDAGRLLLAATPNVSVPFRQNRITIFDSSLPHESDVAAWAPGYANRRISITFLFGDPKDAPAIRILK